MTKRAFVLSGGGSLGAVQVGMLQALAGAGVWPDLIVGTSVGAVNGAWLAGHPDPADLAGLKSIWWMLRRSDVFPTRPLKGLLGFLGYQNSLVPNSGLRRLVQRNLTFDRLEAASIPFHVVAVDVLDGTDVLWSSGSAIDRVLASAAIPGVFSPIDVDGRLYMDGGTVNNTPISHALALGADEIWVLATGSACSLPKAPRSALGMALHGVTLLVQQQLARDVERYEDDVDLRVIPLLCPIDVSPIDFQRTPELIERARTETGKWLASNVRVARQAPMLVPHSH